MLLAWLMACHVFVSLAAGQTHVLRGRVWDANDNSPLAGAHILLEGTHRGVFTRSDGRFELGRLSEGTYALQVSFLGYETYREDIQVDKDLDLEVYLSPGAAMTAEVVVQATRASGLHPATYTNLNKEELEARNLGQDLPVLISLTPSVIVSSDAGTGIGYTWMNIRGSDNSRINVTINGIPVNDAESHGVWWVNMPDLVSSVDNIQIQRGVGLSTHGSGAFGASVNLLTTDLQPETYAVLNTSAGSFNTLRNTVSFGTGLINGRWAFDGRLSRISSEGFIDRASAELGSYYLSGGYYGERTLIRAISFSGRETTYQAWNGVPGDSLQTNRRFNPSGMYLDADGDVRFYENETDNYQQDHHQLHFSHNFSSGSSLNASLHYTRGKGYYEQYRSNERFSRYGLPDVQIGDELFSRSDLVRRRWLDNHFYGGTYSLLLNPFPSWGLTLGGGMHFYDGDHYGEIIWARYARHADIGHRYYDNNAFKADINQFAKIQHEWSWGLGLFADMQYRYIRYRFLGNAWVLGEVVPLQQEVTHHFFNPKAGLTYTPDDRQRFHAYGGIANREPVRRDYTESSPESRPSPETLRNLELGYRYAGHRLMLGANLYYMNYKDQLILTGEINDVGGYTRKNIPDSYRAGVELEAGFLFSDRLQFSGNLSLSRHIIPEFTETTDVYDNDWNWTGTLQTTYTDTPIAFSPAVVGAGMLTYRPFRWFSAHWESKYVGKQYIDNTGSPDRMLHAYLVNDLRLQLDWEPQRLQSVEFILQIRNLFDAMYETNAWVYKGVVGDQGLVTIDDGYFPQAGRHFMAGVNLRF